jgi:uncharacterized protein (DUF1778 family)
MASVPKVGQARVDFRIPASVKAKFVEAAVYESGGNLSGFLVSAGLERAERVLAQRDSIHIDETTRDRFYAAMRAPARPSKALRKLLTGGTRYRLLE